MNTPNFWNGVAALNWWAPNVGSVAPGWFRRPPDIDMIPTVAECEEEVRLAEAECARIAAEISGWQNKLEEAKDDEKQYWQINVTLENLDKQLFDARNKLVEARAALEKAQKIPVLSEVVVVRLNTALK